MTTFKEAKKLLESELTNISGFKREIAEHEKWAIVGVKTGQVSATKMAVKLIDLCKISVDNINAKYELDSKLTGVLG